MVGGALVVFGFVVFDVLAGDTLHVGGFAGDEAALVAVGVAGGLIAPEIVGDGGIVEEAVVEEFRA